MKYNILLVSVMTLALAGCGHSPGGQTSDGNSSASQSDPSSAVASDGPQSGPTAPLNAYKPVEDEPLWVAYAYYARAGNSLTDEQKLKIFVPGYDAEQDVFKKRELAKTELPKINAKLKDFASLKFFVAGTPVSLGDFGPYDFQTSQFTTNNCKPFNGGNQGAIDGQPGVQSVIYQTPEFCSIKITDSAMAQQIESLRSKTSLGLKRKIYFRIDGIDKNSKQLNATVTHMQMDLSNYSSGSGPSITSIDLGD
ncbi:MAG: hypothetical protein EPN74_14275 [Rhodanobacter sp.]|nr:MAG: hypothetical protein EPN74_14275 [Rhodanobacter sp.]